MSVVYLAIGQISMLGKASLVNRQTWARCLLYVTPDSFLPLLGPLASSTDSEKYTVDVIVICVLLFDLCCER